MNNKNTKTYFKEKQATLPLFISDFLDICDPVLTFEDIYIDGSKFEANANKYSWVWKKATEKTRYKLFEKITVLLDEINEGLVFAGLKLQTNTEYVPEELKKMAERYAYHYQLDPSAFIYGKGHRKTVLQMSTLQC